MELNDYSFDLKIGLAPDTESAGVYDSSNITGTPADRIRKETEMKLLGAGDRYWFVEYEGKKGYVAKVRVVVEGVATGHDPVGNMVSSSLGMSVTMVRPKDEQYIVLEGTAELTQSVDYIAFFLWDEWQRTLERTWLYFPDSPVISLDATDWSHVLPTKGLTGGRKMLCIQGMSSEGSIVLARLPFFVAGKVEQPLSMNDRCTFSPNEPRLLDARVDTWWSPTEKKPELTVTLPEDGTASLIQMEWFAPPDKTEITVMNREGEAVLSMTQETGFYVDAVSLPEDACTVIIHPYGKRLRLSSLRVYDRNYPREMVQQWQPMPDKLDILLFSAHQDDEILFYSGLTPWYSHLGKKVGIVYMADCGRPRYREALDAIWFSGMRIHPVFLGYRDKEISSMKVAANIWPGSQEAIVRQIRRCKPDVIVVQDRNGEYGHTQHKLTSQQVCQGVEYAADPNYDPESAAEYGTWKVKKLYVHLYEENQVHMDWHIPMEEYGGFTPWETAVEAFELHHSQYGYFRMERQSLEYDSSCFGLYHSTVGNDTAGNDLMEHIN